MYAEGVSLLQDRYPLNKVFYLLHPDATKFSQPVFYVKRNFGNLSFEINYQECPWYNMEEMSIIQAKSKLFAFTWTKLMQVLCYASPL